MLRDRSGGSLVFEAAAGRLAAHVAPMRGRLVAFSSGAEFPHFVEQARSIVVVVVWRWWW